MDFVDELGDVLERGAVDKHVVRLFLDTLGQQGEIVQPAGTAVPALALSLLALHGPYHFRSSGCELSRDLAFCLAARLFRLLVHVLDHLSPGDPSSLSDVVLHSSSTTQFGVRS